MSTISLCLVYEPAHTPPSAGAAVDALNDYLDGHASVVGTSWPIKLTHDGMSVTVSRAEAPNLIEPQFARARLDDEERERLKNATDALMIVLDFDDEGMPMAELDHGLSLVRPLLDEVLAVFDPAASSVHPGAWASSIADAPVPPRPESLFAMHAVTDGDNSVWIHTHGLSRFGLPEIEVLEVPTDDVSVLGTVLNTVATRLMLEGVPDVDEEVAWGRNIEATLVPWTEVSGLAKTGGTEDERDELHANHNRVLVSGTSGSWVNLAESVARWGEHPVMFRSNWETARMEALAAARWEILVGLFGYLGEHEDFKFIGKFGYAPDEGFREHLWFELGAVDASGATAVLLNEPHQELGMHEGEEGFHALDDLSDFTVYTPFGAFDPETVPQLAAWLQHQLERQAAD